MKSLWKKGLALILAGTMAVSLAACGGKSSGSDGGQEGWRFRRRRSQRETDRGDLG